MCSNTRQGFTLIELSIVLVIIGLIVGGVLVGQDLISAAAVRAQISQIEKYNTAVNTFYGKYQALPGDLSAATATQFGFRARGASAGEGDADGVIKGNAAVGACGFCAASGEGPLAWEDLTTASLIDGSFSTAVPQGGNTPYTGSTIDSYLPAAKIGNGNYVYIWSGGPTIGCCSPGEIGSNGKNYFGLSAVSQLYFYELFSTPGLTVRQAHAIDTKMDDGLPQSGSVTSIYLDYNTQHYSPVWASSGGITGAPYTTATAGSATTCFDNGNTGGGLQQYSVRIRNGSNVNCALSFQFQ